ncbi:transcription repressor OFP8-like [Lolium rigidum]|uniref:transcription repressor OFP8-like n=1 Tax=Lolium rigidum TaxID=89674 RepID=UPI001F5D5F2D|nr:transcription repressor OFP8-like [Lolium rigidum]
MDGAGNGRKKLKHRLAAILSVFSRRSGGRKRRDEAAAPPPLALPSYARMGAGGNGKKVGGQHDRRLSVSARRAIPLIRITIDCAGRRSVDAADPSLLAPLDAKNMETSEWEGRQCPPSSPFPIAPLPPLPKWTKDRASTTTRRLSTHSSRSRLLMSSSSSDDEYDEHSSRNLFSSRSFSSDSSDFYNCPRKNTGATTRARASVSGPPCRASARRGASQSCRYSFELPRGSTASAATDGGFAVVKRSADPYEDFRRSMEEMIAGWPEGGHGIQGEEQDAEGLLETYLVLNSPRHYPAILAAFADVRETLCPSTPFDRL